MCLSGNCSSCANDRAEARAASRAGSEATEPTELPFLAPFDINSSVTIAPVANGGFVVSVRDGRNHPNESARIVGAFTNRGDLLVALSGAF